MKTLTQETAQQIIDEYCTGVSTYDLADKYDRWQTSICNIISGRSFAECKRPDSIHQLIQQRHEKGLFEKGRICHIEAPPLTDFQMDIATGSLLGDGHLHKTRKSNSAFSKVQKKLNYDYLNWHFENLFPYSIKIDEVFSKEKLIGGSKGVILERKQVERFHSGYNFRTHQHPVWTELREKWYPNGIKIVPKDLELNPQRIAIWYFDDGSNSYENRQVVFCTQSFTLEEAEFLLEKLKKFNLFANIVKIKSQYTGREMPILKIGKLSYDNLIELVKPFMLWDCFKHKITWRRPKKQWEISGKFTEEQAKQVLEMRKTMPAKKIAPIFNVHVNTIYDLVSGRSWKHLHK